MSRTHGQTVVTWDGPARSSGPIVEASWAASDQPSMTRQEAAEGDPPAYDEQEKMSNVDSQRQGNRRLQHLI